MAQCADIKINAQGFNDGEYTKAGAEEIRFTQTEKYLYVAALAWPENGTVSVKSLANDSPLYTAAIKSVELLGYGKVNFQRTDEALIISLPEKLNNIMPVMRIKKQNRTPKAVKP